MAPKLKLTLWFIKKTKVFTETIAPLTAYSPRIGALCDPVYMPAGYFKGNIDEVRVWPCALLKVEIAANMNNHV